jgi:hypothetical protein
MRTATVRSKDQPVKKLRFKMWLRETLRKVKEKQIKADKFRSSKVTKRVIRKWRHKLKRRVRRRAKQQRVRDFRTRYLLRKGLQGLKELHAQKNTLRAEVVLKCLKKTLRCLRGLLQESANNSAKAVALHTKVLGKKTVKYWRRAAGEETVSAM